MKNFTILPKLAKRAKHSKFYLGVLNFLLARTIPFNYPHKFSIQAISTNMVRTRAPYRRSNYNHIRGIHACAIATVAEFSAGFLLLTNLDPKRYRLIMAKLEAEYFYQAKEDILAEAELGEEKLQEKVLTPLIEQDSATIVMSTIVRDISGNEVARVNTTWQVKKWDSVRTRI